MVKRFCPIITHGFRNPYRGLNVGLCDFGGSPSGRRSLRNGVCCGGRSLSGACGDHHSQSDGRNQNGRSQNGRSQSGRSRSGGRSRKSFSCSSMPSWSVWSTGHCWTAARCASHSQSLPFCFLVWDSSWEEVMNIYAPSYVAKRRRSNLFYGKIGHNSTSQRGTHWSIIDTRGHKRSSYLTELHLDEASKKRNTFTETRTFVSPFSTHFSAATNCFEQKYTADVFVLTDKTDFCFQAGRGVGGCKLQSE